MKMSVKMTMTTNRDDPDEEEGVEGEDDEHGHLHHPQVTVFFFHEHAGRFLRIKEANVWNKKYQYFFKESAHISASWLFFS